jgi:hypothetical protein
MREPQGKIVSAAVGEGCRSPAALHPLKSAFGRASSNGNVGPISCDLAIALQADGRLHMAHAEPGDSAPHKRFACAHATADGLVGYHRQLGERSTTYDCVDLPAGDN